eukprot:1031435-Prymnesium_polylepis.1
MQMGQILALRLRLPLKNKVFPFNPGFPSSIVWENKFTILHLTVLVIFCPLRSSDYFRSLLIANVTHVTRGGIPL